MAIKRLTYSLFLTLLTVLTTVGQTPVAQALNVAQFNEKMQQTAAKTVLDVRTDQETAAGVLPGAITLDFFRPDFKQQLAQLDKAKPVFVYCAIGGRSGKAMQQLQEAGFKTVYNLAGGMQAWQKAGLPIAKKAP